MAHHTRRHGARSPSHALASSARIITSKSDTCCSRVVAIWRCCGSPPPKTRRCMRESGGVCVEGGWSGSLKLCHSTQTHARVVALVSAVSRRSPGLSPAQAAGGLICCLQRGRLSPQTERSTRLTHAAHARQRETQACVCACAPTCGLSVHVLSVLCVSVRIPSAWLEQPWAARLQACLQLRRRMRAGQVHALASPLGGHGSHLY